MKDKGLAQISTVNVAGAVREPRQGVGDHLLDGPPVSEDN